MDSRWALARSVRALVAERDALKEKLESSVISFGDVGDRNRIGHAGRASSLVILAIAR
jgi:hypothetical protein